MLFTATATGTYEQAAAVATKWGCPMDDSTVHVLVQRQGARAEAQTQARLKTVPVEITPVRAPLALDVVMVDAFLVRFRGPDWGQEKATEAAVAWHEMKTGIYYRHDQAGRHQSGRELLAEKVVVSWQGAPAELGERLHYEALRRGLGRAGKSKRWATARPGSGTCSERAGRRPWACWTSTTPASTCGNWAARSIPRTKSKWRRGWNRGGTSCATGRKRQCSKRSRA